MTVKNIRVTYRRRHCYRTKSNRIQAVKTPGGRLVGHYVKKTCNVPKCGDCKEPLKGIPAVRPYAMKRIPKRDRKVFRAYGGSRCGQCVRERIVRAFLVEEQKIVKKVVAERKSKEQE